MCCVYYVVVDESEVVFIGEPFIVGEGVQVIIDCGRLINATINSTGISNPLIMWYKNGSPIPNRFALNVEISADNRSCVISETLISVGGQLGTEGNYTCEVCTNMMGMNCSTNQTTGTICSEWNQLYLNVVMAHIFCIDPPHFISPVGDPINFPGFLTLTCGQDITVQKNIITGSTISLSCSIHNGTDPFITEIHKNNILISNHLSYDIVSASDDDFGTYNFTVSNLCGHDVAVSKILRQGEVIVKKKSKCC